MYIQVLYTSRRTEALTNTDDNRRVGQESRRGETNRRGGVGGTRFFFTDMTSLLVPAGLHEKSRRNLIRD